MTCSDRDDGGAGQAVRAEQHRQQQQLHHEKSESGAQCQGVGQAGGGGSEGIGADGADGADGDQHTAIRAFRECHAVHRVYGAVERRTHRERPHRLSDLRHQVKVVIYTVFEQKIK